MVGQGQSRQTNFVQLLGWKMRGHSGTEGTVCTTYANDKKLWDLPPRVYNPADSVPHV